MHKPIKQFATASAIALLAAGCAVGPDFKRPTAPAVQGYTAEPLSMHPAPDVKPQHFVEGMDIPADWWALFHSPALNNLVEQTLKSNPTLTAAQASLRQAQENVYSARGRSSPPLTPMHRQSGNNQTAPSLAVRALRVRYSPYITHRSTLLTA